MNGALPTAIGPSRIGRMSSGAMSHLFCFVTVREARGSGDCRRKVPKTGNSGPPKHAAEFMFWGCFSYDREGPFHIWDRERAEAKASKRKLDGWNEELEPEIKRKWEIKTGMRRLALHNLPGKRPNGTGTGRMANLYEIAEKER